MKERIIIEDEDFINKFPYVKQLYLDSDNAELGSIAIMIEQSKKESIPETWEELLELCANLEKKNVFIINDGYCIEFNGLYFWKNGNVCTIEDSNNIWATKTKVTPARMWQIIKNLIGEE